MSWATLYVINKNGTFKEVAEFKNSHGFSPAIWGPISEKYLGDYSAWLFSPDKLWPLYKDERLPTHWRTVLASTYDHAIIEGKRMKEMAEHFRKFSSETQRPGYVNHLCAIADHLDKLPETSIGACFYVSLGDDLWEGYNVKKGKKHFFVFEGTLGIPGNKARAKKSQGPLRAP